MEADIAVVCLPGSSGPGAYPMLERLTGGNLRYVEEPSGLGRPDLILLPDTEQIMKDMAWLHQTGMVEKIYGARRRGTIIFGIGGGSYLLGEMISDPRSVEEGGSIRGLGLIPEDVILSARRTREQVQGTFNQLKGVLADLSYLHLEGEEVHLGVSMVRNGMQAVTLLYDEEGNLEKCEGSQAEDVYGTCVRGIFEREETARKLLQILAGDHI